MKIIYKIACFFWVSLIAGCTTDKDREIGSVKIDLRGDVEIPLVLPKTKGTNPWRMSFDSPGFHTVPASIDKLTLCLTNKSNQSLTISLNPHSPTLVVKSGETITIFEGTIDQLIMINRNSDEELALISSRDQDTKAILRFVTNGNQQIYKINVGTFVFRYGF